MLIVGAGIAGLALARALRRRHLTAEVIERMPEWETSGAGLYLPGNSVRALRELGLWEELAARANPIVRQRFLDHRAIKAPLGEPYGQFSGGAYDRAQPDDEDETKTHAEHADAGRGAIKGEAHVELS